MMAQAPAGVKVMQAGPETEIEIVPGPLMWNVAPPGSKSPSRMLLLEDEKLLAELNDSDWLLSDDSDELLADDADELPDDRLDCDDAELAELCEDAED